MIDIYAVFAREIVFRAIRDFKKSAATRAEVKEWVADQGGTINLVAKALKMPVGLLQRRLSGQLTKIEYGESN